MIFYLRFERNFSWIAIPARMYQQKILIEVGISFIR